MNKQGYELLTYVRGLEIHSSKQLLSFLSTSENPSVIFARGLLHNPPMWQLLLWEYRHMTSITPYLVPEVLTRWHIGPP